MESFSLALPDSYKDDPLFVEDSAVLQQSRDDQNATTFPPLYGQIRIVIATKTQIHDEATVFYSMLRQRKSHKIVL